MDSSKVKRLLEEELARDEPFHNSHGITPENVRSFLVEPFAVRLESTRFELFSPAPIYPAFEIVRMTAALEQAVEELGPDDPFGKIVLNGHTPKDAATELVNDTKLADPEFRKQLVQGGGSAVAASADPMIVMERNLDPVRRENLKWFEENV